MKTNAVALATSLAGLVAAFASPVAATGKNVPDPFTVKVLNLYPEDCQFDVTRKLYYQSNLWKGRISVTDPKNPSAHFNVLIPNVSSTGYGQQQLAGLVTDKRTNAKRLYAVAKDSKAFDFNNQRNNGPSSFHAFNLPLSANSKPVWSVDLNGVQTQFATATGTRPFGPVDAAVDGAGNVYVVFELGIPAIAKFSSDGKTVTAWYSEASNGSQRPGYTGITYDAASNKLIAYGGPRILTAFDLSGTGAVTPNPAPVTVSGNYGSLLVSEKLVTVPSLDGSGNKLLGVKSPYVYSFSSPDGWVTASYKRATRSQFTNAYTLLNVCEGAFGGGRQIYGVGGYLGEGPKGGRTNFPMYLLPDSLLQA